MSGDKWIWGLAGMLALVFVGAGRASAAENPAAEMKTAEAHAGYAAKAEALTGATLHLHHVLNCMVGPQDKRFDPAAGNPCQGEGNGALPDLKGKAGDEQAYYAAKWVAEIADQGIASQDLPEAHAAAHDAGIILRDATKGK